MFKDAKVGDKVCPCHLECGTIIRIEENTSYPICVKFDHPDDCLESYTLDGFRGVGDLYPAIFPAKEQAPHDVKEGLKVSCNHLFHFVDVGPFTLCIKQLNLQEWKVIAYTINEKSYPVSGDNEEILHEKFYQECLNVITKYNNAIERII